MCIAWLLGCQSGKRLLEGSWAFSLVYHLEVKVINGSVRVASSSRVSYMHPEISTASVITSIQRW
jgi:hypothetical protein